ncbi:MAG TPA: type II toxin-antitoxin system HicA family toxin [Candidatus Paceibacterota bacterium]
MKRIVLLKYLRDRGCFLVREGSKHSVILNPSNEKTSTVPRHNEVDNYLARKICKDLGIPIVNRK